MSLPLLCACTRLDPHHCFQYLDREFGKAWDARIETVAVGCGMMDGRRWLTRCLWTSPSGGPGLSRGLREKLEGIYFEVGLKKDSLSQLQHIRQIQPGSPCKATTTAKLLLGLVLDYI